MTVPPDTGEPRRSAAFALAGASVAFWFVCPFWMLTWVLVLPLGATGLALGVRDYRAARRAGVSRAGPVTALALAAVGTSAALAYMVFALSDPDLPVQG